MVRIGDLRVEGYGVKPASRKDFKMGIRRWAHSLGLTLRFVRRKEGSSWVSYCDPYRARAIICERVGNKVDPLPELIETTLHEIAHWIQYNEGMFRGYFGTSYYGGMKPGSSTDKDVKRLFVRAERHADFIAGKLMRELYGLEPQGISGYQDAKHARKVLKDWHGIE